jgi:hypothetical protein
MDFSRQLGVLPSIKRRYVGQFLAKPFGKFFESD